MITDDDIKKSRKVVQDLIKKRIITKAENLRKEFFMKKSENALETAHLIMENSGNKYEGYIWVINTSYYSMFYAATTLLAEKGIKIDTDIGIHRLTYHSLIYYYLENRGLSKHIMQAYLEMEKDAEELLQIDKQANRYIERVKLEMDKRNTFTYEMGKTAKKAKAETSIRRAKEFITITKEMIKN